MPQNNRQNNRISSRTLNHYLRQCRHRRSEENQGTDDPFVTPSSAYVDAGTFYMLPGVVPKRGPGGFINGGHGP
jgi:hypothetical protein